MSWILTRGEHPLTPRDYGKRMPGSTQHLLLYPGFKGNPEVEDNEAFRYPHQALRQELADTDFCVIIGFSFRDPAPESALPRSALGERTADDRRLEPGVA